MNDQPELFAVAAPADSEPLCPPAPPAPAGWPAPPAGAAWCGLHGEIVAAVGPHTEADPVAVLG
ncbi:MAG: DUF3987 domain-containing protein, partial [Acidimicrobiales bacterium]